MYRRLLVGLAASAVLVAGVLPAAALAGAPTNHVDRIALGRIDPSFKPLLSDASRQITVVLQLAGTPALATPGLTKDQQKTRAHNLRDTQGTLDAGIKAAGGHVTDRFQYAYNGIKVKTTGSRLAKLAALPGVVAVRRVQVYNTDNTIAVPYIGAPTAWQAGGATGAGQTIAIIDTGIDYTHATFGGPGTFPTAKVIDGWDFAGDAYDADKPASVPVPDADPMDCNNHGTHVSGSAAGQGVTADHSTYTGPYNSSIYADPAKFVVGPGVAPQAKLVALKVFGCEGSTNLVVDALEWVAAYNVNHADPIDVVNMSLGSSFGSNDDPDAVATNNLVDTGVVVVASAGNENAVPFVTGAPAAATKAISVAALDAVPTFPGISIQLPAGPAIQGNNMFESTALPVTGQLHVPGDGFGGVTLGCDPTDFDAASAGKIVAVKRGVCNFTVKVANAIAANAIGVIIINRDDTAAGSLPPIQGVDPAVTVPVAGTDKVAQATLVANEGGALNLVANMAPSATYRQIADFSSSGPRYGDNALKPDVSAPGVSVFSSLNGSGWDGTTYSGTSMAAPMTSGVAALVRQAHPSWSPLKVKAAIVNTADAGTGTILGYDPLLAGSGVVQANRAVATTGLATTSDQTANLSFGYDQINGSYSETKTITLWNSSSRDVTYKLTASSSYVTLSPSTIKVHARSSATVKVKASLTKAQAAALPTADAYLTGDFGVLSSLSGAVTATPTTSRAGLYALRVPYLLVPRGLSDVQASMDHKLQSAGGSLTGTLDLENDGVHSGWADVYALGVTDARGDGANGTDIRATGVQTYPSSYAGDPIIQFAVNSWDRFTTPSTNEVDVAVDTNGDGAADYYVTGIDQGLLSTGTPNGMYLSVVFDADWNALWAYAADAPLNGSTVILMAYASDLGLAGPSGSFTYWVAAGDLWRGAYDETAVSAPFDVFAAAQSTGDFLPIAPRGHASVPVWADAAAAEAGTVSGWMVVTLDDRNGASQADIVRLGH
jgi:minor extracellular serine protease Vpr